jgi:hypothetical protein
MIYFRGYGPYNFEAFLNYVVDDLQLMQRVGGGYIFSHRMILEHFAELDQNTQKVEESKVTQQLIKKRLS